MGYNLTEGQKNVLRWFVQNSREGKLSEEFIISFDLVGYEIIGFKGNRNELPEITTGMVDVLASEDFLYCKINTAFSSSGTQFETGRNCMLMQKAFDAVDNDFQFSSTPDTQVTIGAIIHTMSGGNIQTIGIAQDASISQIINDPELLQTQLEALTDNLLNEVKSDLKLDQLLEYTKAIQDLRVQASEEKPNPSLIQNLVRTLGFLGDIEGTISLMTRVWPYLHPILLIIASKLQ